MVSPLRITLRQLRWRHITGILLLPCWFDADRRSWRVLSNVQSLGKYLWMMSCYQIGRFPFSTLLKLSNGNLVAEKVPSLVRLKYVHFCHTYSRAFQEPHRKQDIWLRKSQCNLNVIIYRTSNSSERVKLTGESCTYFRAIIYSWPFCPLQELTTAVVHTLILSSLPSWLG